MFDVKAALTEVNKELADERMKVVKVKLKASLKRIEDAKLILANAQREHEALLSEIAAGVE